MQTTLNKIKSHSPCEDGWKKLLNYLGKTQADDEPLELRTILESNGVDDTIWAFRAVKGKDKDIRLFAADCAELVLPIYEKKYPNDDRPRKAIQAARDYANGLISEKELVAAWVAADAARAAARDAARAAAVAAWVAADAARAAARDAAWDAARAAADAAWVAADAARAAARDAAWDAADAAWVAADAAADAAWDAARVAADAAADAARDAADAARAAADAARAAADAARAAARDEIKSLILKYI